MLSEKQVIYYKYGMMVEEKCFAVSEINQRFVDFFKHFLRCSWKFILLSKIASGCFSD